MEYNFEVAGIYYDNKDGTSRKNFIKKHLDIDDYAKINVSLIRHGGNKHDRNAIYSINFKMHGKAKRKSYRTSLLLDNGMHFEVR